MKIILALFILSFVVSFHELGHFIAARMVGVKVHEFSVGIGPSLIKFPTNRTLFSIRLLLLGGYCLFKREEDEKKNSEDLISNANNIDKPYEEATSLQRLFIMANGVIFNFILAFLIFLFLFTKNGEPVPAIKEIYPNSQAELSNLEVGDTIKSIDGIKINDVNTFLKLKDENKNKSITLTVERNGKYKDILINNTEEKLGIVFEVNRSLITAFKKTLSFTNESFKGIFRVFRNLFGLKVSKELAGPIGFVKFVATDMRISFDFILLIIAVISLNLGIFNMLPIPPLDGGNFLSELILMAFKGKIAEKIVTGYKLISYVFFAYLFFRVLIQDVTKLL